MNTLREAVHDYIDMRRNLGFKMNDARRELLAFVAFMESRQAPFVTVELALEWAQQPVHVQPSDLQFEQVDAPLVVDFLDELEAARGVSVRSRNLRLAAVHSFFRYASFELPTHAEQIQRVLAIPAKRYTRRQVGFLARDEVDALLAAPDRSTWSGRRDHAFILTAVQTGFRLSEMTGLTRDDFAEGDGRHLRVVGKGRKERCTPLAKPTRDVLRRWLQEPPRGSDGVLFPSARGNRLGVDGVQYLLNKHRDTAAKLCPSLVGKRVTVHVLRHTAAMDLMQVGVHRSVIALWLGHERAETTQIYVEATLAMKEQALAMTSPRTGDPRRYQPPDSLLAFLSSL